MNKEGFLAALRNALAGLPPEDIDERVSFYAEMIEDRMEEGASEAEAVERIGSVDDVVSQILADVPLTKIVKEKIAPKRSLRAWEIVLIVLGFPMWFPLIIAACVVVLAIYVALWVLIVSLWEVELSLVVSVIAAVASAVVYFTQGEVVPGIAMFGAGVLCAGLTLFLFIGCVAATKGAARLTKKIALGVKRLFIGKEKTK